MASRPSWFPRFLDTYWLGIIFLQIFHVRLEMHKQAVNYYIRIADKITILHVFQKSCQYNLGTAQVVSRSF